MARRKQEMPHNIDAEAAILGAVITGEHPNLPHELITKLKADDFYHGMHQAVYKAISQQVADNKPVGLIGINEALPDISVVELTNIMGQQCFPSQFDYYCRLVKENSTRRKLIEHSIRVRNLVYEDEDIDDILSDIEKSFYDITKDEAVDWETNFDLMVRHQKTLSERYNNKGQVQGVKTGFVDLDKMTGGWRPGQLIFLGAVPKMGKTSAGLHFALHSQVSTLFFTLEMLPEEIADRQLSIGAQVKGYRIKNGYFNEDHWQKVTQASRNLSRLPIGWVKKSGMTVTEIRAVCRRFQAEHGLGLVIIDQLDKIHEPRHKGEMKTDIIGRVTSSLKNMARDLEVPVIVLVQLLDKATSKRASPRPTFGDIRDSSCPDQDGDVIIYLWRPEFYWPQKEQLKGKAEIIVSRQRSGAAGSIWVTWQPDYTAFLSLVKESWPKESDLQ